MKVIQTSKISSIIFVFISSLICAQENSKITNAYEDYTKAPREVAYVHLNKSTYIKGEDIGFTAYVLDKKTKKPSQLTTNLYISIEDENKIILNQKLIKVENGVASNVIKLDSSFTSGYYTFKAYTNWMRNFDEQNYFIETIRVIDPKKEEFIKTISIDNTIDAQFLPEGGHLVDNVINNVGVIIKDAKGFGIPNLKGKVYNQNQDLMTEFTVNHLGIGRFPLLANINNSYSTKFEYLNKEFVFNLKETIEPVGVSLAISNYKNLVFATLKTNNKSLKHFKNKSYKLTLHNGNQIDTVSITFEGKKSIIKAFELNKIPTGTNVFTLFNENNEPISERLYFNYVGLNVLESDKISTKTNNDSINISIDYSEINPNTLNNFSISVLPQETASYNRHHSIVSYNFLRPYVKGNIENAKYYFTEVNDKTKHDLDNLLLTQGWSSYDWKIIFKDSNKMTFPFEQGISIKANTNSKKFGTETTYMINGISKQKPIFIKLSKEQKAFLINDVFLFGEDSLYISEIGRNNKFKKAGVYLQTFPNRIPYLNSNNTSLKPKENYKTLTFIKENTLKTELGENVLKLNEVIVKTTLESDVIRARRLSETRFGRVEVITKSDILSFRTLQDYLKRFGVFHTIDIDGGINFHTTRSKTNSPMFATRDRPANTNAPMNVFLDGIPLPPSTSVLNNLLLINVDYVEVNTSGIGEGFRGAGGVLKIYTNPKIERKTNNKINGENYGIPLTFSSNKKFYVPKYQNYNDEFFKNYGTIDWKPRLILDSNNNLMFTIASPETPITLFIEGIANNGSFIFEEKKISFN